MKIAAAQINPTIGDFAGNSEKILTFVGRARELEAQLVVFPEMCLTGYPPRDLLERPSFIEANIDALNKLGTTVVVATHDVHLIARVAQSEMLRLDRGQLADPTGALRNPPRRPTA